MIRAVWNLIFFLLGNALLAQLPVAAFSCDSEHCLEEPISFSNTSSNSTSYIWDFCTGDFNNSISTTYIDLYSDNPYSYEVGFSNEQWYGFSILRGSNSLLRHEHGSSLASYPNSVEIANPDGTFSTPLGFSLIEFQGNWYGFVVNFGSDDLIMLEFGSDLANTPSGQSLGNFGIINNPDGVVSVIDNGNLKVIVLSRGDLVIVDFGSDPSTSPTSSTTSPSGSSRLWDLALQNDGTSWYGIMSDFGNGRLVHVDFGSEITNTIGTTSLDISPLSFSQLRDVSFQKENGEYHGFAINKNGEFVHVNFGTDPSDTSPIIEDYGDIDPANNNDLVSLNLVKQGTIWYAFKTGFTGRVYRTEFESECDQSIETSTDFEPQDLNYTSSGTKSIELRAFDESGRQDVANFEFTVLNQTAPSISFTTDNACVSFEGSFDADTPDLTYTWDFGDGSIASGQNTSHQFASSGTYTVRLDVDDGTCSNFTEQEITIYEEPPIPDFEVVGNLCADGEITFNNLTDDGAYTGPLTYQWDFNGQSTADTRDASFVFGSEGSKTVTLTSSIPGCENFFQTVIDLQPGPTSLFSGSSVCQNELLQFTNTSSDADTYMWDFGDGFTSTQADASHVYTSSGNFTVQLEAFDLDGCSAIYEQEVAISPEPVADFSYDVACKGNQGVEFTDQSTVSGADILAWEWRVNDQLISTEQSPTLSFDETGLVDVSLTVTSSNGCTQLYEETLDVLEDPDPSIQSDISCQSLVSTFTDNSANPETIVSRVWEIEGQTYTTQEVQHTFSGSGQIDVNLTVTGQNFCSSTLYTTVEIQPAASMNFSVSSYCDNDQIIFQDQSTSIDPIVSRTWTLDGETFFNGTTAALDQISSGTYTIGLSAQTESGCTFETEQIIDINEAPEAAFSPSATYGAPPFTLSLTNNSIGATSYRWLINGNEIATSANTTYTISEEGDHTVELVASNASGCEDRHSINVVSRVPAINLIVSDLTLTPNGNSQNVTLRVSNNGNLPIEIFDVFVSSSNDFSFSERINQMIEIGSEVDVQLNSTLQATSSQRICVKIQSAYDDINPDSNEACINFTPKVVFEDIYPNPFKDEAVVRFILPKSSNVRVTVANSTGKLMIKESYSMDEGLQILRYDSRQWEKGLYFISVLYNGEMTTKRVLKF